MCHAQFDLYIYFLLFSFFLNNEKQSVNFYTILGSTTIFLYCNVCSILFFDNNFLVEYICFNQYFFIYRLE